MLRRVLLSLSRSVRVRHLVETAPVSRGVVARFVAGTSAEEAVAAYPRLVEQGAGWCRWTASARTPSSLQQADAHPRRLPARCSSCSPTAG